eukprot:s1510_g1.t1
MDFMNPCSGVDRGQSFADVSVSTLLESAATPSDTSVTTRAFRALRTYFPLHEQAQAQASASTANMMTCSFDAHAKAALHRAWQDWAEVESQSGGFSDTGDVDVDQPCAGIVQPTHPAEVLRAAWENIRQGLCKQRDGDLNVKQAACHLLFALRLALLLAPGAEKTSPQSCIVLGGPGTGKTYILNLNAQLLERFCPDSAVSCAFMNAAARLVQGTTLHAAFDLRQFHVLHYVPEALILQVPEAEELYREVVARWEMVAFIPEEELEELSDVKSLKQHLNQVHSVAPRFRQRLFRHGESLKETAMLDSAVDLYLVVLPFTDVSQSQVENLVAAALSGSTTEVESMLQLPQDPDSLDYDGCTALLAASSRGHVDIVHLLLEASANKDVIDTSGCTALMCASCGSHVEVVRLLLEARANMEVVDNTGHTTLMRACSEGCVEIVRLLLEAGASMDMTAKRTGFTALMIASGTGHVEIVRVLLEIRANTDVVDNAGFTALRAASDVFHNVEIVRLLLEASASKDVADMSAEQP